MKVLRCWNHFWKKLGDWLMKHEPRVKTQILNEVTVLLESETRAEYEVS